MRICTDVYLSQAMAMANESGVMNCPQGGIFSFDPKPPPNQAFLNFGYIHELSSRKETK